MLISSKFPIGVATIYRPGFIIFLIVLFIFLSSCAPVNFPTSQNTDVAYEDKPISEQTTEEKIKITENQIKDEDEEKQISPIQKSNFSLVKEITIILPDGKNNKITQQFINVIELATYQKKINDISFDIKLYSSSDDLINIINKNNIPGKIFIGPLDTEETSLLSNYCNKGLLFFTFSSQKKLARDCVFLLNFFPTNELETIFNNIPQGSKIALLYPENAYGYKINQLVDEVADQSESIIINRASYKEDLTNVREAIKELGKYELRKYELNRQKQILALKKDENSKKRLKKLEKFQTTKDFDFTHILLPDYGIRLLQVAPLLPYYDVDPNIVQFVGTGVWDDPVFFSEPSLQKAIFPGVEINLRANLINDFNNIYESKLMRTSTLAYDLVGLLSYIFRENMKLSDLYTLLNDQNIKFDGIDGGFYFKNNLIERDLSILQILNGTAKKIN